jgi:RNA polymerase sigma factor (sigma-70 family)
MGSGFDQLVGTLQATLDAAGQSDRDLLDRYQRTADSAAFEAIVRRHGRRVLAACRRVLPTRSDAEDAFQATFLALAHRPAAIRDESVGGWLIVVAHRTAVRIARAAARRRAIETRGAKPDVARPELAWPEACAILHEELDQLPARDRAVLVLCYLDGKSRDEAAQELGLTTMVVKGVLERGRKKLRARLKARGVALSAGLFAVLRQPARADFGIDLVRRTAQAALAGLAKPVMPVTAKIGLGLTLAAGLLFGLVQVQSPRPVAAETPPAAKPEAAKPADRVIAGRVVDPTGKPVAGAAVFVVNRDFRWDKPEGPTRPVTTSDADGRFRVELKPAQRERYVVVSAAGRGADWVSDSRDGPAPSEPTFTLAPDVPITGRVVNTEGKPIRGVQVTPESVYVPEGKLDAYLAGWKARWRSVVGTPNKRLYVAGDRLAPAVTTDADGKFKVTGCGAERIVHLTFRGAGVATTTLYVLTRPGLDPAAHNQAAMDSMPSEFRIPGQPPLLSGPAVAFVAAPGRTLTGRVTDTDTGKPIAGVRVNTIFGFGNSAGTVTAADGTYTLEGIPRDRGYSVHTSLPDGDYLDGRGNAADDATAVIPIDIKMTKGVVVRGRVVDPATGKGLLAGIRFNPLPGNKYFGAKPGTDTFREDRTMRSTDADGWFRVVTIPGRSVVTVQVHSAETFAGEVLNPYRLAEPEPAHRGLFESDEEDGWRFTTAAGDFVFLSTEDACPVVDVPESGECTVDIRLNRGKTATLAVQDEAGRPLTGAVVAGLTEHWPITFRLPDATATVYALDPAKPRRLAVLHPDKKLGATVEVRGDEKGPVTVRLKPLGTVTGKFVEDGDPLVGAEVSLTWVGGSARELDRYFSRTASAVLTDAAGAFRIEGVLPGAPFSLQVRKGQTFYTGDPRIGRKQVEVGKTLDLGTVRLKLAN